MCENARCGDGRRMLDIQAGNPGFEECDDGNQVDTDLCMNDCSFNRCGDGQLDPGEECDDGNREDADGCRNSRENGVVVMGRSASTSTRVSKVMRRVMTATRPTPTPAGTIVSMPAVVTVYGASIWSRVRLVTKPVTTATRRTMTSAATTASGGLW